MSFRQKFEGSRVHVDVEDVTRQALGPSVLTAIQRVSLLRANVRSTFDAGIERIVHSQDENAEALRSEVEYQAAVLSDRLEGIEEAVLTAGQDAVKAIESQTEALSDSVEDAAAQIVDAIQDLSTYLGGHLLEVRWAVEKDTAVSRRVLGTLLESQRSESRQFYRQGVACFEQKEFGLAKKALLKALQSDLTNHFAYQYLGFVAVEQDNPNEAQRSFELARKFATTDQHAALASSHLARTHFARDEFDSAVAAARAAIDLEPDSARYRWECALYCVAAGQLSNGLKHLEVAIERDWSYFALAAIEPLLGTHRPAVDRLLSQLRERERGRASEAFDRLKELVRLARGQGVSDDLVELAMSEIETQLKEASVYSFRQSADLAQATASQVYEGIRTASDRKLGMLMASHDLSVSKLQSATASIQVAKANLETDFSKRKFTYTQGLIWSVVIFLVAITFFALSSPSEGSASLPPWFGLLSPWVLWWLIPIVVNMYLKWRHVTVRGLELDQEEERVQAELSRYSAEAASVIAAERCVQGQVLVVAEDLVRAFGLPNVVDHRMCSVELLDAGANKSEVIKVVCAATHYGFDKAKKLVDCAPRPLKRGVSKEKAEYIAGRLRAAGATVRIV